MPMTPGRAQRLKYQVEDQKRDVGKLAEERDQLRAIRDQLQQLRDQLIAQRDNFRDQRDVARDQRDQAILDRQAIKDAVNIILNDPVLTETEKLEAITGAVA